MSEHTFSLAGQRVWVAGHRGMVGSALVRRLGREGCDLLEVDRGRVDLRNQQAVKAWTEGVRPAVIFVAAAKVGGILANHNAPAEFLYDNLMIEANIIHAAWEAGVEKLLFLGSSCIYPRLASQPITEDALLSGPLEPTNEWYAVAKIAGIKLCQAYRRQYGCDFISAMPSNLYGPGDNYHPETSHVVPALIRKVHEAREARAETVEIWGTGTARREFLHVDDCADALVHLVKHYSGETHVNVGSGSDVTIDELAFEVMSAVGFRGKLTHDLSKPDGTPRKLLDSAHMRALGWAPRIGFAEGLRHTYEHSPFFRTVKEDIGG